MAPPHAAITALGVTAAMGVLNTDTIRDAGTALRWLVERTRQSGRAVNSSTIGSWGRGTSTTLKAIQLSALAPFMLPSDQLRHLGATKPHHRLPVSGASSRHRHVPAMIWTSWALRLRPNKGLFPRTLRPALSAALLLPGTRHSPTAAAELLGTAIEGRDVSRVLGALRADPHWPHILAALTRLADYLSNNTVPIDYHRRRHLDYSNLLPSDQWHHICRQSGVLPGRPRRLDFIRCLLFEKISTAPVDRAPASFFVDTTHRHDFLRNFTPQITPNLAMRLDEAAQEFLAQHGIPDEPVEWQPPAALLNDLSLPGDNPDRVDLSTLHRLISNDRTSVANAAQQLGTTSDVIRYLLQQHPAPPQQLTYSQARATGQIRATARSALSKELLTRLRNDQNLTLREIGRRFGVSSTVINSLLDEYSIPRRQRRPSQAVISRDWLYDQYINHRRTLLDLARETGVSTTSLARWAKAHDIPLRPRGGGSHNHVRVALDQTSSTPRSLQPALTGRGAWDRLQRFAAATVHPTITSAAKALGLHQGALTSQINRLERELGGPILTRAQRGHPMRLTPLGRKVLAAIRTCSPEEMPRD